MCLLLMKCGWCVFACECVCVCALEATGEDRDNDLIPLLFCRDTFFHTTLFIKPSIRLFIPLSPPLPSSNSPSSLSKKARGHTFIQTDRNTHKGKEWWRYVCVCEMCARLPVTGKHTRTPHGDRSHGLK